MALTDPQRRVLQQAILRYLNDQRLAGNVLALADLVAMTAAARKTVLQPYVDAINLELTNAVATANAAASATKTDLQAQQRAAATLPL